MRVYVDTSVYGGAFDEEFQKASRIFFEQVRQRKFHIVISAVVQEEINDAPAQVRKLFEEMLSSAEIIAINTEALALQAAYLKEKIISSKWSDDALHVALATIAPCEIIASWNFKHIVHYEKIQKYNAVNKRHGYKSISIHSPLEIIHYEKE